MVAAAQIIALTLAIGLGTSPIVIAVRLRRAYGHRCPILVRAYAAILFVGIGAALLPWLISVLTSERVDSIGYRTPPALALAVMLSAVAGPIVTIALLMLLRRRTTGHCPRCGYNLTGNVSGVCSECGMPCSFAPTSTVSIQRPPRQLFRADIGLVLLAGFLIIMMFGIREEHLGSACTKCVRYGMRVDYRYAMPFTESMIAEWDGELKVDPIRNAQLSNHLDPECSCEHDWVTYWGGTYRLLSYTCGIGPDFDFARSIIPMEDDFDEFVTQNPEVIPRIRANLLRKERFDNWLFDAYLEWSEAKRRETD